MKMRTIDAAAAHFKAVDPDTALTKTGLRRLVTTGAIPSVKMGTKFLVSLESVEAYMSGDKTQSENPHSCGNIRRVEV